MSADAEPTPQPQKRARKAVTKSAAPSTQPAAAKTAKKATAKKATARKASVKKASVPSPLVAPAVAPPSAPEHSSGEPQAAHHQPSSDRFRVVLAILIALISVMGAITTWRAEVAGSDAGEANSEGEVVAATAAGQRQQYLATALSQAHAAQRSYEDEKQFTFNENEAKLATSTAVSTQLRLLAQEDNDVALKLLDLGYWTPDYVPHSTAQLPTSVDYDINRQVDDLMRENEVDTDSQRWYDEATAALTTRNQLYGVDLLLVLALALMALAQIVRRRRTAMIWAAPGGVLFVAALILFTVIEA